MNGFKDKSASGSVMGGKSAHSQQVASTFEIQALEKRVYLSDATHPLHMALSANDTSSSAHRVNLAAAASHAARKVAAQTRAAALAKQSKFAPTAKASKPQAKRSVARKPTPVPALAGAAHIPSDAAYTVAVQSDGKILTIEDHAHGGFVVTRRTMSGDLDPTFGHGGRVVIRFDNGLDIAHAIVVDNTGTPQDNPDFGKIIVAGTSSGRFAIARLLTNGKLDKSFGTGGKVANFMSGVATGIMLNPGGAVVIGGVDASGQIAIRLTNAGKRDWSFGEKGIIRGGLAAASGGSLGGIIFHAADCCGGGGCCNPTYSPPSVTVYNGPTFSITKYGSISPTGYATDNDPNATWSGTVNYGDGSSASLDWTGNDFLIPSHQYTSTGTFGMDVSVTDTNDGQSSDAYPSVMVTEPLPSVSVPTGTVVEGNTYTASGSFTDSDTDVTSFSATVNYGDGTATQSLALSGNNFSLSHAYHKVGTFPATVTVTANIGSGFNGSSSGNVAVTVPAAPAQPTNVAATVLSGTEVAVTWLAGTGSSYGLPDTYIIQRTEDSGETFQQVGTVDQNHTIFLDTGLSPGQTYSYQVIASNGGGQNAYPNYTGVTPSNISGPVTTSSTDTTGFYKVTAVGSLNHPNDGYTASGSLSIANSNYILTGSAAGAMLQAVTGTISVSQTGQSYSAGVSGALMPGASGLGFDDVYSGGGILSYTSGSVSVTTQQSPVAAYGTPTTYAGDSYLLNLKTPGIGSYTPNWTINWGDGSSAQNVGNVTTATHNYTANPTTCSITATCVANGTTYTAPAFSVQVQHEAPVLTLSSDAVAAASHAFTLNLSSSDNGSNSISSWSVNWGDGSTNSSVSGSSGTPTHTYSTAGTYTISASATDSVGTTNANPISVTVISNPGSVPAYLKAAAVGGTLVDLNWSTPADPSSTFIIKQLISGSYTQIGTAGAGAKSYQVTGLTGNTSYSFEVYVSGSTSGTSNTTTVTTLPTTTLYSNDFQTAVAGEWSNQKVSTTPIGARTFLGDFGNNTVTLNLGSLPTHVGLSVSFDLFVIRTWDGTDTQNIGPDQWKLTADGNTLLDTTFSNVQVSPPGIYNSFQNYPAAYGSSTVHGAMYGATEKNTLGYTWYRPDLNQTVVMDSVYHINEVFAHTSSTVAISFQGLGLQALSDESWGIDNVQVVAQTGSATSLTATASPPTPTSPNTGPITLRWINDAESATSFEVDRSTDGVNFAAIGTTSATASYPTYVDNTVQPNTLYYYKVHAIYGTTAAVDSNIASTTSAAPGYSYGSALDSVTIPVTAASGQWWSSSVQSNITLTSGVHYELVATGDFFLGGPLGRADAADAYNPTTGASASNSSWPDHNNYGIGINDVGYPTIEANHNPYWGAYNSNHVYMIDVVGTGQKLTFDFHDNYFYDNVADDPSHPLQVQIFQHMPAAPINLAATPDPVHSQIKLSWIDEATDETGFRIERETVGGTWALLQTISGASAGTGGRVTAVDATAAAGVTYNYRVFALTGTQYASTQSSNVVSASWTTIGNPVFTTTAPTSANINPYGKTVSLPSPTWALGEVLVSTNVADVPVGFASGGVVAFSAAGTDLHQTLTYQNSAGNALQLPGAGAFTANGNFVIPDLSSNSLATFNSQQQLVSVYQSGATINTAPIPLAGPNAVVFDGLGNMYLSSVTDGISYPQYHWTGSADGIWELDSQDRPLRYFPIDTSLTGTARVDTLTLSTDQHTLYLSNFSRTIFKLDTNTGLMSSFVTIPDTHDTSDPTSFTAAGYPEYLSTPITTTGTSAGTAVMVVSGRQHVYALDSLGNIVQQYDYTISNADGTSTVVNDWYALALNPDHTSFWAASSSLGVVVKFDIATGAVLGHFQPQEPEFGGIPDIGGLAVYTGAATGQAPVQQPVVYYAHATGSNGDLVTYTLTSNDPSGANYGASIDPKTGVMSWTPTVPNAHTDTTLGDRFTITATDATNSAYFATQTFVIAVGIDVGNDQAPVISSPQSQFTSNPAYVGHYYTGRVMASDPNSDALTYSLLNSADFTMDPATGTFGFFPTNTDLANGQKAFTVEVSDGRGGVVKQTFSIPILTGGGSLAPFSFDNSEAVPTATVGQAFENSIYGYYSINLVDSGSPAFTYSAISLPDGMTLDPSRGELYWTPTAAQTGQQSFTVGVLSGGYFIEKTFVVNVVNNNPTSVTPPTAINSRTDRLQVVTTDPNLVGATYTWSVPALSGGPAPVVMTEDSSGDTALVTFGEAGTYTATITATTAAGSTTFTDSIAVAQVPSQIVASPAVKTLATSGSYTFTGTLLDQFGNSFTTQPSLTWSLATNASGASINTTTGAYTAGGTAGTDVIRVWVTQNGVTANGYIDVAVGASGTALAGSAATGYQVLEGTTTSFGGSSGLTMPLVTFYDNQSGNSASSYSATVTWGDGSSTSSGTITSAGTQTFAVAASHAYALAGTYTYSVAITAPGSRSLTVAPLSGKGIVVLPAAVTITPQPQSLYAAHPFTGLVASFVDRSALNTASEYVATINWGDGTSSPGVVAAETGVSSGYTVTGSHTYGVNGTPPTATVTISEVNGSNSVTRGAAALQITVAPAQLLTPQDVQVANAVSGGNPGYRISWVGLPNDYCYEVLRINPDGTQTVLNGYAAGSPYFDAPPSMTARYGYEVLTGDGYGNYSEPSPVVYAAEVQTPTGLLAAASDGMVKLTWNAASDTIAGWDVLRKAPTDTSYTSLLNANSVLPPAASPEFDDDTAVAGVTYSYEIVAVNDYNARSNPDTTSFYNATLGEISVAAPTGLTAGFTGSFSGVSRIGVQWNPVNVGGLLGYNIYRSTSANFTADAATLIFKPANNWFTDDVPATGASYYYIVRAIAQDSSGNEVDSPDSAPFGPVSTAANPTAPPPAPSNLLAVANADGTVTLNWTDNSVNEMGFEIRRSLTGTAGSYTFDGLVTQNATSFVDTALTPGTTYFYEVAAYDVGTPATHSPPYETGAAGQIYSTWSNAASAATAPTGTVAPSAVSSVSGTASPTSDLISLTWTASSTATGSGANNLAGYYVYRKYSTSTDSNALWVRITPTPTGATSYLDTDVQQGASYSYEVTAVTNGYLESTPTTTGSTPLVPDSGAPTVVLTAPQPFSGVQTTFSTNQGDGSGGLTEAQAISSDGRIQTITAVQGIVDGPSDLTWSLYLHATNVSSQFAKSDVLLASGTGPMGAVRTVDGTLINPGGATLAQLDPSQYPSGEYQLYLMASIPGGSPVKTNPVDVSLYSPTKLGNLTLPVTDMTVNVPNGTPITIQRVYDSQDANTLEDFGYGWKLNLSNTSLTSTALPAISDYGGGPTFRVGDLVYVTLPSGQQYTFQFLPVPISYDPGDGFSDPYGGLGVYTTYWPQFISADGSGASLTVPGDMHSGLDQRTVLTYDANSGEFYGTDSNGDSNNSDAYVAYNPALPSYGGTYQVQTKDGSIYNISAVSGQLQSSQNPDGQKTTYSYSNNSITENGTTVTISRNADKTISQISVALPDSTTRTVNYTYLADGTSDINPPPLLASVTGPYAGGGGSTDPVTNYYYGSAVDSTTSGDWTGAYGADGYDLFASSPPLPSYASVTLTSATIGSASGSSTYLPQSAPGSSTLSTNTASASVDFTISLNLGNGSSTTGTHQIALYMVDSANLGLQQTLTLRDVGNNILNSATVGNFQSGKWVVFTVSGDETIDVHNNVSGTSGTYAVINAIMFDPARLDRLLTRVAVGERGSGSSPVTTTTMSAAYNQQDQLVSMTNGNGNSLPLSSSGLDTANGSQGATTPTNPSDPSTESTQTIYDSAGGVARTIQSMHDSSGTFLGYQVTVTNNQYVGNNLASDVTNLFNDTGGSIGTTGFSNENALAATQSYAPFFVPASDSTALSDATTDSPATLLSETDYNIADSDSSMVNGLFQPSRQIQFLGNGYAIVTSYGNYTARGAAQSTSVDLYSVSGSTLGTLVKNISTSSATYDAAGNMLTSTDATGLTTYYGYSNGGSYTYHDSGPTTIDYSAIAKGLLLESYIIVNGSNVELSKNVYSTPTTANVSLGMISGMLYSSTDASGKTTYTAYTADGQVSMSYSSATVGSTVKWVVSTTYYDADDRATSTTQCVYDGSTLSLTSSGTAGYPTIGNTIDARYGSVLTTSTTTYDASGHTATTTDAYGSATDNLYDADGNVIQTVSKDGQTDASVVQSVYDSLGRVEWQTDSFSRNYVSANGYGQVLATHTLYDAAGRVIETDRYEGTQITISSGGDTGTGTSALTSAGTLISKSLTYYDDQGRAIETVTNANPDGSGGTRTGTVYYPNDQVEYTGPLTSSAPDGGHTTTNSTTHIETIAFTLSDLAYVTYSQYDLYATTTTTAGFMMPAVNSTVVVSIASTSGFFVGQPVTIAGAGGFVVSAIGSGTLTLRNGGSNLTSGAANASAGTSIGSGAAATAALLSNSTTDPLGNTTTTYQDAMGQTVRTVYPDGSFTETLYSSNGVVPTTDAEGDTITLPPSSTDWSSPSSTNLPAGDSVTIQIVQRKSGDPAVYTISLNNAAGQLIDEWQPAVPDALNSNTSTMPHWRYTYDTQGNELSQIDPKGNTTSWTYDEQGNQLTHTLPGGQEELWTYNENNQVVTHTDFDGNMAYETYDTSANGDGRQTAEYRYAHSTNSPPVPFSIPTSFNPESPASGYPNYSEKTVDLYDDDSSDPVRGTTSTSAPSSEIQDQGRVMEVQEWTKSGSSSPVESFWTHTTYDPATGQQATISSPEGTVNYVYDPVTGREVRMWSGTSSSSPQNDTAYAYDSQGRLIDVYALTLNGTNYGTYTGISSSTHNPTFSGTPIAVGYAYDNDGDVTLETQPDGDSTSYTYNSLNELTDLVSMNGTKDVFVEHYDLLDNGQREDVIDKRYDSTGTLFSQTTVTWAYDALNRLTDETLTVQSGGSNAPSPYHDHFAFDLDGNRTEEDADTTDSGSYNQKILYTYNSDNELMLEQTDNYVNSTNPVTTSTALQYSDVYTYDANGSMLTQTRTGAGAVSDTYTYDLRNRMTQVSSTVGTTTTTTNYAYGTNSAKVSEGGSGGLTYYLNDPQNPTGYTNAVQEMSSAGGTPVRSYLFGLSVEAQRDSTNGTLYLLHDGHGSTRALFNSSGAVVEKYDYDAFGDLLAATGYQSNAALALTIWQFAGDGTYDAATGDRETESRFIDGFHFSQRDPTTFGAGDLANANLYDYVGGRPVDASDPSGHGIVDALASFSIIAVLTSEIMWIGKAEVQTLFSTNENPSIYANIAGPDITNQLEHLRSDAVTRWGNKPAYEKDDIIDSMSLSSPAHWWQAWEITDLNNDNKYKLGSQSGEQAATVTVNSHAFWADEVNYYWYGVMTRLIDGYQGTTTLDSTLTKVAAYRGIAFSGLNIPGRQAWVRAGYYGNFELADPAIEHRLNPNVLQYPYPITAYAGPKQLNFQTHQTIDLVATGSP